MVEFRSVAMATTPGTSPASTARCSRVSILLLRVASAVCARARLVAVSVSAALPATRNFRRLVVIGVLPVMNDVLVGNATPWNAIAVLYDCGHPATRRLLIALHEVPSSAVA